MPTTSSGQREDDWKKLPLPIMKPFSEAMIQALFEYDKEKMNILFSAFLREVGAIPELEVEITPHEPEWQSMYDVKVRLDFMGKIHEEILYGGMYYKDKPDFASDANRGARLMSEIWCLVSRVVNGIFEKYLYSGNDVALYEDTLFYLGQVPAYDYEKEARD